MQIISNLNTLGHQLTKTCILLAFVMSLQRFIVNQSEGVGNPPERDMLLPGCARWAGWGMAAG